MHSANELRSTQKVTHLMLNIYPSLTPREGQCLFWCCLNLTKKEIADRLRISENTVKSHLKTAIEKQEVAAMRDIKTAFLANLVIYALLDAREGMEGDTHSPE